MLAINNDTTKKKMLLIIMAVVSLVLVVGGYFAFQSYQSKQRSQDFKNKIDVLYRQWSAIDNQRQTMENNYNGKRFTTIFDEIKELKKNSNDLQLQAASIVPYDDASNKINDTVNTLFKTHAALLDKFEKMTQSEESINALSAELASRQNSFSYDTMYDDMHGIGKIRQKITDEQSNLSTLKDQYRRTQAEYSNLFNQLKAYATGTADPQKDVEAEKAKANRVNEGKSISDVIAGEWQMEKGDLAFSLKLNKDGKAISGQHYISVKQGTRLDGAIRDNDTKITIQGTITGDKTAEVTWKSTRSKAAGKAILTLVDDYNIEWNLTGYDVKDDNLFPNKVKLEKK